MKAVKRGTTIRRPMLVQGLAGLMSLAVSVSAWGACVQHQPGASTVLKTMAPEHCGDINGQVGCAIDRGNGSCDAYDSRGKLLFTVTSLSARGSGGLSWEVSTPDDVPLTNVDAVIINGARSGEACVYLYEDDAGSGTGMGDFDIFRSGYASVGSAEFCTDGEGQASLDVPDCAEIKNDLDGTGIDCSTLEPGAERFLISVDPNATEGNPVECTCNVSFDACDENATVGSDNNKCIGDEPLKALPVQWIFGNDGTWICRTIAGERQCWNRKRRR